MKKYIREIIILTLIVILYFLYSENRNITLSNKLVSAKFQNKLEEYKYQLDKKGDSIAIQKQVIATKEEAIRLGLINEEYLKSQNIKSLQAFYTLSNSVEVLGKEIGNIDFEKKPDIVKIDSNDYLMLPQRFSKKEQWFNFEATVNTKGLFIEHIIMPDTSRLLVGFKKQDKLLNKIFKDPIPVVTYKNSNPYVKLNGINNVKIKEEKPFYKKNLFWLSLGVFTGFLVKSL